MKIGDDPDVARDADVLLGAGEGRLLLYDRKLDPRSGKTYAAGTKVSPDTTITLYAKKDDE